MEEKVLFVDDEPNVLAAYRRSFGKCFQLDTAQNGEEALARVAKEGPYAVVVSDMRMPGMDGMELLAKLRDAAPDTVRIMLTGNADQQTAVEAVNRGQVFKFLNKPCSPENMTSALDAAIGRYRQTKELDELLAQNSAEVRRLSDRLSHQAGHDILTGLANRQTFEIRLQSFLESARYGGRRHALCFLDIEQFHVINDTLGHVVGDELLRQFSQLLSAQQRNGDLLARLSGDEFGIVLADCKLGEARSIVGCLHEILKRFPFEWEDQSIDLGLSIGLVPIDAGCRGVNILLSAAETACHVARDQGRNVIHTATSADRALTERLNEVQWVGRINQALREERFLLHYQLIVPLDESAPDGDHYELLIRMRDESGEIIPPGAFLPAAEHYHLSPQLDRWVIRHAVDWLTRHPERLARLSLCNINLSGRSIGDEGMLDFIIRTIDSSPVPAQKICFEVTETAAVARLKGAVRFIKSLKARGFVFALDDFGSGLSSFAYLKNLPVDILKIDGMFVRHMDTDVVDRAMVKSINEVGQVMNKKTVAEFVENGEILKQLKALKVDYAQGYFVARPEPLDELG